MRKRHIKSVAHWTIMSLLLLFPVLMVGISAFAHDEPNVVTTYEYETNEVNSPDDLVNGNIYLLNLYGMGVEDVNDVEITFDFTSNYVLYKNGDNQFLVKPNGYVYFMYSGENIGDTNDLSFGDGQDLDYINTDFSNTRYIYFVYYTSAFSFETENLNAFKFFVTDSDYLGEVNTEVVNASYKQEVNNWANGFKNLPVNQWYSSLLDTIGIGQTNNSVMNVIYVYPLYVLWVYILDLVVDCLLLIINFGHDALHRLGADNE